MKALAQWCVYAGVVLIAIGLCLGVLTRVPWLGQLPGDLYYKGERFTVYAPLMTSLLLSALLSLILYICRR